MLRKVCLSDESKVLAPHPRLEGLEAKKKRKERKGKEKKGKDRTGQDRTGKTPPCSGVPYGKQACETRRIYCCFKVLNQVNDMRERAYPI